MRVTELHEKLGEARAWALDQDRAIPDEWMNAAQVVTDSPTKTIVPAYATALLAKATYPRVDALAIKENHSSSAFSLRTVGHQVLVPASHDDENPFDLMARGPEPLNNQPFFRYNHWTEIQRINASARPFFDFALERLAYLNSLTEPQASSEALAGLAAFLRQRFAAVSAILPDLSGTALTLTSAVQICESFLSDGDDRPLRSQAVVAAIYDLAYGREHVDSRGLNDPSRHGPGDIRVLDGEKILVAVEVRAKEVSATDARIFASACQRADIRRAHIVALGQYSLLDRRALSKRSSQLGVLVVVFESVIELVTTLLGTVPVPLSMLLDDFPIRGAERLLVMGASQMTLDQWATLCALED